MPMSILILKHTFLDNNKYLDLQLNLVKMLF